jgi:hypothetical protein
VIAGSLSRTAREPQQGLSERDISNAIYWWIREMELPERESSG